MDHRVFSVVASGPVEPWRKTVNPLPWEAVPTHPVIALKPTSGQRVSALYPYKGNILVGYGDWTNNTGPVKVVGYNAETAEPVTLLDTPVPSEAIDRFREIDGKMYIPWIDPTNGNQGGITTDENGYWENVNIGDNQSLIHAFDVAKLNGLLYVCGSISNTVIGDPPGTGSGVVWRRNADGTWQKVLHSTVKLNMARFYGFNDPRWGIELPPGSLTVKDATGGLHIGQSYWRTYDGVNWSNTPAPIDNTPFTATDPGRFTEYAPWWLHPSSPTAPGGLYVGELGGGHLWATNSWGQVVRHPVT